MKALCISVLLLSAAVLITVGCASTPQGLAREQALYQAGTNGVAIAERYVVPYVPAPWNGVVEGALAVASGGLAAWNMRQQKHIADLRKAAVLNGKLS